MSGVAPDFADVQGLVTRGYRDLSAARMVLLQVGDAAGARAWLLSLLGRITDASANPTVAAVNVAFTAQGLLRLGLRAETVAMFSEQYQSGMTTAHRRLMLGDVDDSAPERWVWGGPTTAGVDALLLLYSRDAAGLAELADREAAAWRSFGVAEVWSQPTVDLGRKEHFGFNDGISQPMLEGLPKLGRPDDTIKAGEFLLGYPNEYGRYTERPLLDTETDASRVLPVDPAGSGRCDLGQNGTYLVLRQLAQDVEGFWTFVDRATLRPDGSRDEAAATWLASKMVGRWPSGASLVVAQSAEDPGPADLNEFHYFQADADGRRCPIGSHVRRSNPRDSLDPRPGSEGSVAVGKRHRIIRRGRSYGAPGGSEERGLMFVCLCGNISRQFEFIQHNWLNNPKFAGLYDDADPLSGVHGETGATFTIQAAPVRRRFHDLPRFITVRGGAYFFLPGLRALHYLASLGDKPDRHDSQGGASGSGT